MSPTPPEDICPDCHKPWTEPLGEVSVGDLRYVCVHWCHTEPWQEATRIARAELSSLRSFIAKLEARVAPQFAAGFAAGYEAARKQAAAICDLIRGEILAMQPEKP